MTEFGFATAGRIVFGAGRAGELPALLSELCAERILVVTGTRRDRYAHVVDPLPAVAHVAVGSEPTVQLVENALDFARGADVDAVVAVGGGSVIDLAKAVGVLLGSGGSPLDHLEVVGRGLPLTGPSLPVLAVPTTAGTGAEVTANAVLTAPEHRRKVSLRSPEMLPAVAVVDPQLTLSCPPPVTAASGLDALTQCLEPLVSVKANPLTDGLALQGLRYAGTGLRAAYRDGSDLAARTAMAVCSLFGGLSLANAKLGAVHGLAGVLGGRVAAAHGAICAALLAATVEVNVRVLRAREPDAPALAKYRQAASALTGRSDSSVADGVDWIRETVAEFGISGLRLLGVPDADFGVIATEAAVASSTAGNPIQLSAEELTEILDCSR